MRCLICGLNFNHLGLHIKFHNITDKEYYDLYIRKPNEGFCPLCGKETTFRGLSKGYLVHCSSKCSNKMSVPKTKKTKFEHFGDENYNNREQVKQK